MCWKKSKPAEITSPYVYLGFGINDYAGSGSDLRGCVNDINNEVRKLSKEFPEFQCLKYFDSKVTTQFFMSEVRRVIDGLILLFEKTGKIGMLYIKYSGHGTQIPSATEPNGYNEALYLYNGPLVDDNIYLLQQETPDWLPVVAKFDSCFSGDMGSRSVNGYRRGRFMPLPGVPLLNKSVNHLANPKADQKWIIFSGCGENQTSADAYIEGQFQGAFSWADMKSYGRMSSFIHEVELVRDRLEVNEFEQIPELSGPYYNKFMP